MQMVTKRPAFLVRGDVFLALALYPYAVLAGAVAFWAVGLHYGSYSFILALTPVYRPSELIATYVFRDASGGTGVMLDWFGIAAVYLILRITLFYKGK